MFDDVFWSIAETFKGPIVNSSRGVEITAQTCSVASAPWPAVGGSCSLAGHWTTRAAVPSEGRRRDNITKALQMPNYCMIFLFRSICSSVFIRLSSFSYQPCCLNETDCLLAWLIDWLIGTDWSTDSLIIINRLIHWFTLISVTLLAAVKVVMGDEVGGTMTGSQERLKDQGTLQSQGDKSGDEV